MVKNVGWVLFGFFGKMCMYADEYKCMKFFVFDMQKKWCHGMCVFNAMSCVGLGITGNNKTTYIGWLPATG